MLPKSTNKRNLSAEIKTIRPEAIASVSIASLFFHVYSDVDELESLAKNDKDLQTLILTEVKGKSLDVVTYLHNGSRTFLLRLKNHKGTLQARRQSIRRMVELVLATSDVYKGEEVCLNYLIQPELALSWTHYYLYYLTFKYTKKQRQNESVLRRVNVVYDKSIDGESPTVSLSFNIKGK